MVAVTQDAKDVTGSEIDRSASESAAHSGRARSQVLRLFIPETLHRQSPGTDTISATDSRHEAPL